jgi:8-oxo-dGTP diphosphatase
MHVLVLIRHAIAEDRETWAGDDDAGRPLTSKGRKQARRIARIVPELLREIDREMQIASLRSSPAVRCVQTVEPLAENTGSQLTRDQGLYEGSVIRPPSTRGKLGDGAHVLCAHGDNIPWLLEELDIDWDGKCKKGSIWLIQRDGRGAAKNAKYVKIEAD